MMSQGEEYPANLKRPLFEHSECNGTSEFFSLEPKWRNNMSEEEKEILRDPEKWRPKYLPMLHDAMKRVYDCIAEGYDPARIFAMLLDRILDITCSEYGFIGEHRWDEERQQPYLKTFVLSNLPLPLNVWKYTDLTFPNGLKFYNLNSLFGYVIRTGEHIISNDPSNDPNSCGIPEGHPPINAYLGLPLFIGKKVVGSLGLANRPTGYSEEIIDFIQPYMITCANILMIYSMEKTTHDLKVEVRRSAELSEGLLRRNADIEWLRSTTNKIRSFLDQPSIIKSCLEEVGKRLEALCCCFMKIGENNSRSELSACWKNGTKLFNHPLSFNYEAWIRKIGLMSHYWIESAFFEDFFENNLDCTATLLIPILFGKSKLLFIACLDSLPSDREYVANLVIDILKQVEFALSQSEMIQSAKILETEVENTAAIARAKSSFLACMSHEIRTPLHSIIANIDFLQQTSLTNEQLEMLNTMKISGKLLMSIINDILDYSKFESGALSLDERQAPIYELVEKCFELLDHKALEKKLHFNYIIEDDVPTSLLVDDLRLKQIIINLLSNAIKFTSHGEVLLRISTQDSMICFTVHDTGIGILTKNIPTLFSRFSQADSSTTREYGGTGLGLAISKQLVELMGGSISVRSAVGQGSEFSFKILKKIPEKVAPFKHRGRKHLLSTCIYLILRNRHERESLARKFEYLGCSVLLFSTETEFNQAKKDENIVIVDEFVQALTHPSVVRLTWDHKRNRLNIRERIESHGCIGEIFLSRPLRLSTLEELIFTKDSSAPCSIEPQLKKKNSSRRILVVEDNPINQRITDKMIRGMGNQSVIVSNGIEAVEEISNRPEDFFDLILMDIHMPKMDGIECSRTLRSQLSSKCPKIIAMSASLTPEEYIRCIDAGMEKIYLSKPTTVKVFEDVVQSLLDS